MKNINFHEKPWSGDRLITNDKKKQGLRSNYLSIGKIFRFSNQIRKLRVYLTNWTRYILWKQTAGYFWGVV